MSRSKGGVVSMRVPSAKSAKRAKDKVRRAMERGPASPAAPVAAAGVARFWCVFERRGGVVAKHGPFATLEEARGLGQTILALEPIDVRAWCRAVFLEGATLESAEALEEFVYVDHARPEARNRAFGFSLRVLSRGGKETKEGA